MVRTISLMAHMMLINVWYPAHVQAFFSQIFVMIAFDLIPTEYFYPQVFGFSDIPYASQFEALGYGSHNVITNIGSMFLVICF